MAALSYEQFAAKAGPHALMFSPKQHSDVIEGRTSAECAGLKAPTVMSLVVHLGERPNSTAATPPVSSDGPAPRSLCDSFRVVSMARLMSPLVAR